jgi:CHRD domain-containing protein
MKTLASKVPVVLGILLALGVATSANDRRDRPDFRATLVATQEVPVVSSLARGTLTANFEPDGSISYKLEYSGLEGGNTLFAHIHLGQRSVNGGVMTFLCGGGTKPTPCPNVSGTVEGNIAAADIQGIATQQVPATGFDEFVRALKNGTAYANVHTTASPGGEIRGQVKDH